MKACAKVKKGEGSVFISALIISSLLFVMGASFLLMISSEYKLNNRSYRGAVAINLAEAGADYAIWSIADGDIDSWAGIDPKTKMLSSIQTAGGTTMGDVSIEVFDPPPGPGNNPIIESTGYMPNMADPDRVERKVRVQLEPMASKPFNVMLHAKTVVDLSGQAFTDSYDSRLGGYGADLGGGEVNVNDKGSVSAGHLEAGGSGPLGHIELGGQAVINGDAATRPGGTIEMSGQAQITGDQTHDTEVTLEPVVVPAELTSLGYWDGFGLLSLSGQSTYTLDAGNYKFRRLKLSGQSELTINGPATIYVTGYSGKSIDQAGQSIVTCNGEVTFYCDEDVKLSGQGVYNTGAIPADLLILGTDTCDWIKYSGQAEFYGAVYAPEALVDPSGQGGVFGAFIGNEMDVSGQSGFHYDEALGDLEVGSSSGYSVVYWQEKE